MYDNDDFITVMIKILVFFIISAIKNIIIATICATLWLLLIFLVFLDTKVAYIKLTILCIIMWKASSDGLFIVS